MTRQEIIRLAHEAGRSEGCWVTGTMWGFVERFAEVVAAHEREACAKAAEGIAIDCFEDRDNCGAAAACLVSGMIRARGEQ